MNMAAPELMVLLLMLVALALPVGLWLLIERETADEDVVARTAAERSVRDDDQRGDAPTPEEPDRTSRNWGP